MRRISLLVVLGTVLLPLAALAVDFENRPAPRVRPAAPAGAKFDTTIDFVVDNYNLYVTLPMYNDSLYGHLYVGMCTNVPGVDTIRFQCGDLAIDSVFKLGTPIGFNVDGGVLAMAVAQGRPNCFGLDIFYRGGNFTSGYHWYPQGGGQPHTIGYTMSEPQDARYWMPCVDEPWLKTTQGCEVHVSVPDSFTVAANGLLADTVRSGDTLTWHWVEAKRIATYLMCFTVSRYASWTDTARTAAGDTIPLYYCVWPEDSAQAAAVFDSVPVMLECFTQRFGHYPFEKYGMAAAYPFGYGGMEHQTMTTIHRSWITNNSQKGVVHELGHMWWGDKVTCGHWSDIWLNEGFASYGEAVYDEYKSGRLPGVYMKKTFSSALAGNASAHPVYDPPAPLLFDYSMEYAKGAWVLQGLRWVMGDPAFFAGLRAYGDSFAYGNAVSADFQRIMEYSYGAPLGWYFDQWLHRAGHPAYTTACYYGTHGDSNAAWVKVTQTSTTGERYAMPLALACSTAAGPDSATVAWDSLASQDFLVHAGGPVAQVRLDPGNWVLKDWYDRVPVVDSAETVGPSTIVVRWHPFTADSTIAGYNLYRSQDSTTGFTRINRDIITDTAFADTNAMSCLAWYYRVTAVCGADTGFETHPSNIKMGITGGVAGGPAGAAITSDGLAQNAPNPFARSTAISYQIARSQRVSLQVFNVLGQLVKTLDEGNKKPGRYQVAWDGRDQHGRAVSSGIYLYCLRTGGSELVRRMQVVR
ncbi:MAG TPA: M1 family aminopeptidase [Candidatus Edwardsbacteria bacterium]|nr:M1 family aminopeptidase [Candidatus Edwardsbacteria bacterium]